MQIECQCSFAAQIKPGRLKFLLLLCILLCGSTTQFLAHSAKFANLSAIFFSENQLLSETESDFNFDLPFYTNRPTAPIGNTIIKIKAVEDEVINETLTVTVHTRSAFPDNYWYIFTDNFGEQDVIQIVID